MHLVPRMFALITAALCAAAGPLRAQSAGAVEALAPVLAAEDARSWNNAAMRAGLSSPDSTVRALTAMAVGRLHARGVELLVPLLVDRDTTVRVAAVFALGLLHDSLAVAPLVDRLRNPPRTRRSFGTRNGDRPGANRRAHRGGLPDRDPPAARSARFRRP